MSGDSASFFLLEERIQRFLWADGWESLRDAQEAAIPLIVNADRDVIVAAATAAGKAEAAFLPALTNLRQGDSASTLVRSRRFSSGSTAPVRSLRELPLSMSGALRSSQFPAGGVEQTSSKA